ncbi:MAG: hypothetical protein OEY72_09585 [Gammaproteobacteria bacterium]|nr:hypothetical protein [Gammaproteobacteria bacterium]
MPEVDPLSVIARLNQANYFVVTQQSQEAHKVADGLLPQSSAWASYWKHADAAEHTGNIADGIEWGLKAYAENPNDLASNFTLMNSFNLISEHAEARRVSDSLIAFAELAAGNNEEAVRQISARLQADPENLTLILDTDNIAHAARQFDIALRNYEEYARRQPAGRPVGGPYQTLLLAWNRRPAPGSLCRKPAMPSTGSSDCRSPHCGRQQHSLHNYL